MLSSTRIWSVSARSPFLPLSLSLAAGICVGRYCHTAMLPMTIASAAGLWLLLWGFLTLRARRMKGLLGKRVLTAHRLRNGLWWGLLPLIFVDGIVLINFEGRDKERQFGHCDRMACGVLSEKNWSTAGEWAVVSIDSYVEPQSGYRFAIAPFKVLLRSDVIAAGNGDRILFPAQFTQIENGTSDFDYKGYMYGKGIDLSGSFAADRIVRLGREPGLLHEAQRWRESMEIMIEQSKLSLNSKGLLCALLLGDKTMISADVREDFAGAGIAHVLAVSGLHVGIIALIVSWVFIPFDLRGRRKLRYMLTIILLLLFAMLTGLSAPVVRAVIMAVCVLVAMIQERQRQSLNLLCLAAFVMLFFNPRSLFDIGFQLSFAATFAVVTLAPLLTEGMPEGRRRTLTGAVGMPIVVFLVLWPLLASGFKEISLLFLPANLLLIPLLPLFLGCMLLYVGLLAMGVDWSPLRWLTDTLCTALTDGAGWLSSAEWAHLPVHLPDMAVWLIVLAIAAGSYAIIVWSRRATLTSALFFVAAIAIIIMTEPAQLSDGIVVAGTHQNSRVIITYNGERREYPLSVGRVELMQEPDGYLVWIDRNLGRDTVGRRFPCRTVVVGSNYSRPLQELTVRFQPQRIMIAPWVSGDRAASLREEAARLGLTVE